MITDLDILDLLSASVQAGPGIRVAVSGRSMGPAFAFVTEVQVVPCDPSSIPAGRLVVFQREGRWVVHRVMYRRVRADGVTYLTKGDGLGQVDQPEVHSGEIKGLVSALGVKDGSTVDLLSVRQRLRARWTVIRFWMGRIRARSGTDPRSGDPG